MSNSKKAIVHIADPTYESPSYFWPTLCGISVKTNRTITLYSATVIATKSTYVTNDRLCKRCMKSKEYSMALLAFAY